MSRHTYSGLLAVRAWCDNCGWASEARNAQGLAAQHCDKYEHSTHVESTLGVAYLNDRDHDKKRGKR